MSLKDWKKTKSGHGWIFIGNDYKRHNVYVYKKGWFRTRENFVVVTIYDKEDDSQTEYKNFDNEKDALTFASKYMRSH
jgi:hypothetical protein